MENQTPGPFCVVRVDPYNGARFPVAEDVSEVEAIGLVDQNQAPGRDVFLVLGKDGTLMYPEMETPIK